MAPANGPLGEASTPSKRRRTSATTYVAVSDQENHEHTQPNPSTPKRASYQSPTKASLARSNPKVLQQVAQAKERRESVPNRRQSLRETVLGNVRSQPEAQQDQTLDILPTSAAAWVAETTQEPSLQKSHTPALANNITDAFKDPPGAQLAQLENTRPPAPRQERSHTPRDNDVSLPPFTSPSIVPKLVQSTSIRKRQDRRSASAELPPTPVQLGSNTRPDRPRGLASSSPGGSGRRRVRARDGHVTSSPLKPKAPAPPVAVSEDDLQHAEIASGIGDEPEDTVEEPIAASRVEHDEEADDPRIREKQQQLRSLQDELHRLQEQYGKLSKISITTGQNKLNGRTHQKLDESLEFILQCLPKPKETWPPRLEDHTLFQTHHTSYLTLFTPGKLRMSYQCWEESTKGRNTFVYQTTFAAPQPWPPNVLNLTFDIITDQETGDIVEIVFATNRHQPAALQKWIEGRLSDAVFRTDLATIVAGIGRYFEEDVRRATTMKNLSNKLGSARLGEHPQCATGDIECREDAHARLPYLNTTQYSFAFGDTQKKTRRSLGSRKQAMLTYDISLNWLGQTDTAVDVCTSGFSNNAIQQARRLFKEVEPVDGVESAFEAVWSVLGTESGTETADETAAAGAGKGRGKKKKARRMTEFDSPVKSR